MTDSSSWVLARRASTLEFFKASPEQGFMWGKDPAEALQFARKTDAALVASMVADDCHAVPFGAGTVEGLSESLTLAAEIAATPTTVVDSLACDAAGGSL